jgi:DNA topoisomerase-1
MEQAVAKLKEEKKGRGRRTPEVLKDLGKNPEGTEIKLLKGPYGPYATDGTINASIPRGADPQSIDLSHAMELIRAREQAGPRRKKKAAPKRKKAAKKRTKKKG